MANSGNDHEHEGNSFVAANLAIVDGIWLCLLPPSGNEAGHLRGGSGGGEKKNPRPSSASSRTRRSGNGEKSAGVSVVVPALPLTSLGDFFCAEDASSAGLEEGHAVNSGDGNTEGGKGATARASENGPELMCLMETSMETIRLGPSEISNADYRFIHSEGLIRGSSILPLRVSLCDEMDESAVTSSNDGRAVHVSLPSSIPDVAYGYDEDSHCVFGGEHYDLSGDDDCMADGQRSHEVLKNDPPALEVHGAGSCLVADLLGMAGYDQALVLPPLEMTSLASLWDADANEEQSIIQRKQLLQIILTNSIFITDGLEILSSKNMDEFVSKTRTDGIVSFTFPSLDIQNIIVTDAKEMLQLQSNNASCSDTIMQEEAPILSQEENSNANESTNEISDPIDANNEEESNAMSQDEPAWLGAIAQTVEHRIAKEVAESKQLESSAQARSDLVRQGRRSLYVASRNYLVENRSDPEVIRLRHGTRPRSSTEPCGAISVVVDLEVDINVCGGLGSEESKSTSKDDLPCNILHDFHLSCSLAENKQSTVNQSSSTKPTNIRTVSGVVPTLHPGDCVTVMSSVLLADITTSLYDGSGTSTLDISIQGLWVDALSKGQRSTSSSTKKKSRHGAVLCILRLPTDTLFSMPPTASAPHSRHWIQHEIDFTSDDDELCPVSSAIFEYRQPRTLTIDTSGGINSTQDGSMWKELVSNLNATVGWNSFIDLYCKKGDPRLKLVIFGSNPEERAATVKRVLQSLPESANLVLEDPDENDRAKALVMSLKNEADAVMRHRILPSTEIRPELLAEMAELQMATEGVASTLKRGWVAE